MINNTALYIPNRDANEAVQVTPPPAEAQPTAANQSSCLCFLLHKEAPSLSPPDPDYYAAV
jgi:hypothetical protein